MKKPDRRLVDPTAQKLIAQECGVKMPIRTVGEYLRRWDYTPQKSLKRAYEPDPNAVKH
ncbi:Winged helix-turn helix domain-containing protein [Tumidithrix helvetica PCC 7403]|uniref:helix-turn-helix domain-containing protein n=1 Tax=Tumidithrix helvetica TaxID=3457545 RepID=UPI003C81CA8F